MTTPAQPSSSPAAPAATRSDFSGWDDDATGSDVNSEAEYGLDPRVQAEPNDDDRKGTNRQVGGAAIAAGVAGALLVGPVVGLAAGAGAAVLAARNKGSAGNVARASGEAVANTGERLRKFDQKHHVTAKASKGLAKGAKWVADKTKIKHRNGGAQADNLTA
mmetsp:Transcript_16886/g.31565  ORF Transcript_16886/g.31565 Transcript_16886/m.31565 type:complete len:162 (-) Transcript_16886:42-527(-)|eukprot:scaffold6829_cov171-Amphora_coffeaeformis.AAC.10